MSLLRPYGLIGDSGASSCNGIRAEVPYTVADELKTIARTPCRRIASTNTSVPSTLFA